MADLFYDEMDRVREHLDGQCPADEQTLFAVSVLAERLERLKKHSSLFAGISFSPNIQRLVGRTAFSAVS